MLKLTSLILLAFLLVHCATPSQGPSADPAYVQSIESWQEDRIQALTATDSWLAVAGLYPIKEGKNTFGSGAENDLVFPENAGKKLGTLSLLHKTVRMSLQPGVQVNINANEADEAMIIFQNGSSETIHYQTFTWTVIQRGDRYFLRLWDSENDALKTFEGIEHYPIQQQWRVPATFVEHRQTLAVHNVLDMDIMQVSEGLLHFQLNGKDYELITLDGGKDAYFIIFSDATTGVETYGAGRYLYVNRPDAKGKTWIDFNKAYNPPCAFTPFATCPLPPKENHLDVAVKAGEKDYGNH